MCRRCRSRCATSRARATRSPRCWRWRLPPGADWETALRMANAGGRGRGRQEGHRHRHAGGAAAENPARMRRSRPRRRSSPAGGDLDAHLAEWRKQGLRIGFTNGCFDILHPGHVKVLTAARGACDRLIVGLNSDASVQAAEGRGRPVQDERARAEVLAALEAVDLVVDLRGGHADRPDRAGQAERAGEGRRLHPRAGRRPRDRRGQWRRGRCWSISCPGFSTTSLVDRARGRQGVSERVGADRGKVAARSWRDPAAWVKTARYCSRVLHRAVAAMVDVAGGHFAAWSWLHHGCADARRSKSLSAFAEAPDLARCRSRLFVLALVGTLWSDAPWGARLYAVGPAAEAAGAAGSVLSFRALGARHVGVRRVPGLLHAADG